MDLLLLGCIFGVLAFEVVPHGGEEGAAFYDHLADLGIAQIEIQVIIRGLPSTERLSSR